MKNIAIKRYVLPIWAILFALYFIPGQGTALNILTKVLPEVLLLVVLALGSEKIGRETFLPVVFALFFSILGDIAGDFKPLLGTIAFVLQILMFIVAQVCYTISFSRHIERRKPSAKAIALKALALAAMLGYYIYVAIRVFGALDSAVLTIACAVYMAAILSMGITCVLQTRERQWIFVLGAMFFMFSDSIIALNSFVSPVSHAGVWIMSTYFVAQLLMNLNLIPSKNS